MYPDKNRSAARRHCGSTRKAAVVLAARAGRRVQLLPVNWPTSLRSRMITSPSPKRKSKVSSPSLRSSMGKIVHATEEFATHAPPLILWLPEWSPVKVFGGYGAPLDARKAAQAGVPAVHHHSAECHQHGCAHAAHQLLAGIEAARDRFAGFWGSGCDCFAF